MTFVSVNRLQSLRSQRVNNVCSTISSPSLHRRVIRGLVPRRRSPVRNIRFRTLKKLIKVARLSLWCCMLGCCQHNHSSPVHRITGPLKLGWTLRCQSQRAEHCVHCRCGRSAGRKCHFTPFQHVVCDLVSSPLLYSKCR